MRRAIVGLAVLVTLGGCSFDAASECAAVAPRPGATFACVVPGHVDRAFETRLPDGWDGISPLPIILALHGGGGSRVGAELVTCTDRDPASASCLGAQASARGYAVVRPDGTGRRPLRGSRSWNIGAGAPGHVCSEHTCNRDVDDVGYIDDVFAQLELAVPIDPMRVYATGHSMGGGMTHLLACADRGRFAAIVPVSATNVYADDGGACDAIIPVLDIHGTADPIWPYDGGTTLGGQDVASVDATMEGWRARNGCASTVVDEVLANLDPGDGTTAIRRRWNGCAASTEHIRVDNGGHTWPSGHPAFSSDVVGLVTRDFGSEIIVDFFDAHPHR